ncbi:LLM class flavin-dependent oxidoreductase [Kutzneria sp. CA-103260]|uniref:LLM class flavin-dependent oxidoreductase n=1 Tax=Kutzneria sp. CA-103260 TaxID=2802641 RepID=UPI001BEEED57|nr:LLM class flavin-dependent oxidoreductase [Kutzneria sp. CA-103260]QUQ64828.1 LLM class F420-dependent oxidoreductase [Kutzneria sp. CA-103260]
MVDVGVVLPTMTVRGELPGDVTAAARHAEELGFESVWVVDQLVAGTGVPLLDSLMSLAAVAAVTERVRLGLGVLVVPLRPVVWVAKQVASLQHLSGDRVLLGVGAGGDRHEQSWLATDVPRRERGRRTEEALRLLPDLIAGRSTRLRQTDIQLSPAATVPPIIVGGMSDAAVRRAAAYGDGWYLLAPPERIPALVDRVRTLAAEHGRPQPAITTNVMVAIDGDPSLPDRATMLRTLTDPDGLFGMPAEFAEDAVVTGAPAVIAEHLSRLADSGVERVVVTFVGGDWNRQAELLAHASR